MMTLVVQCCFHLSIMFVLEVHLKFKMDITIGYYMDIYQIEETCILSFPCY